MRKVCIVGDYRGTRSACRDVIRDLGYTDSDIYEFESENAFFKALNSARPDIVIVDDTLPEACGMHGIDGVKVVKYIDKVFDGSGPDVVVLSELLGEGEAEYLRRFAPHVKVVSKPVGIDEFSDALS